MLIFKFIIYLHICYLFLNMDTSNIVQSVISEINTAAPGGTLDSSKIIQDSKSGVTLGEQQLVQKGLPNEFQLTTMNHRAVSHLADATWSLQAMLERENYVSTLTWDTTRASGYELASYNVIEDLLQLSIASVPFKSFRYWRCSHVRVRVQLTANRFLAGRLLVSYTPSMTGGSLVEGPNLSNQVLLQHMWLDPSASTPIDFVIPFNFYKGWVNLDEGDVLGQLSISVFNPLTAAIGTSPSVDIKVFVSVKDSEFKVPLPGAISYSRTTAHSGIMSTLDNTFQDLVSSIMPSQIIGDMLGGLLDKPEVPIDPDVIANKDQAYLSNARGPAYIEKLTLDPAAQQLVDSEHFATVQDELDINYLLKKKYSYIATKQWKATDSPGTIIYEENVGPMMNFLNITPGTRMIDYVSRLFHYWRGAITYMMDIVGTQFHEGRLDVLFTPGINYSISDYKTIQSLYIGSIVVRNGQNSLAVTCPFLSDTPWKQVYYGAKLDGEVETGGYRFDDFASGRIQLVVSSALRAPTNVVPDVEINIFQAAGSDYELCMPSYYNYSINVSDLTRTIAHSGKMGDDMPNFNNTADKMKPITLAPLRAVTYDPAVAHFGDKYTSLRELAKRYQLHTIQPLTFSGYAEQLAAVELGKAPLMMSIPINSETITGYMKNLFVMFRQFRGPLRFKVRLNTNRGKTAGIQNNNHGYVNFLPQPGFQTYTGNIQDLDVFYGYDAGIIGTATSNVPRARFSDTQTAEFEVEFPSNYATQLLTMRQESRTKGDEMPYFGFNLIAALWITDLDVADLSKYSMEVYISFGDTTHLGGFIGIPTLVAQVVGGASPYPDLWYQATLDKNSPQFEHHIRKKCINSKSKNNQPTTDEWTHVVPSFEQLQIQNKFKYNNKC